MPRIFDNLGQPDLATALSETLATSTHADYCVGYFNLRGWRVLDSSIDGWPGGDGHQVRLLIGMQKTDEEELREALSLSESAIPMDNQRAAELRRKIAAGFREQLTFGTPTNQDEAGLRRLAAQLRSRQLVVKLYLRHTLHAKLYLHYRDDSNNPITGFVGSSNLTLAGLAKQGELNVDVLEHDACKKLQRWFQDRWTDHFCVDISDELADVLDASWARPTVLAPYLIYLKIAYHLSREAQSGIAEFKVPEDLRDVLLDFQIKAVQIAAHHLNKRGGVLIGDVVGLGKTLMATALARVFQEDQSTDALIICPTGLVRMWEDYVARYRLLAKVLPLGSVQRVLPELRRYRLVLIDESQNLRNREGKRYRVIRDYIDQNGSMCILLSATPYNKGYDDLGAQLALFVDREEHLGIRPEHAINDIGDVEFQRRHQCALDSLAAFDKSTYADDWRDLMRRYMVRRTRSFIQANYAEIDPESGRQYLAMGDGSRSYFPTRLPRTVKFQVDDTDPNDPYARLYRDDVVLPIAGLQLPRYGLGQYLGAGTGLTPTAKEADVIEGLGRAGNRLIGFCATNLFKRLESGGPAFIQSVERHVLRNFVFLHAIENGLDLPIGSQDAAFLDEAQVDEDVEAGADDDDGEPDDSTDPTTATPGIHAEAAFRDRAAAVYESYATAQKRRFKWIRAGFFDGERLAKALRADALALIDVLTKCGTWDAEVDAKLHSLVQLVQQTHPDEKVLIFTQFADTARYLEEQLKRHGVSSIVGVTGNSKDPTAVAWRFSPVSNDKRQVRPEDEIRVLVATDVLSEGQNLQDGHIVVNYDLPWAIVKLIQRAGRVDRIGQQASEIDCYSFLPAEGVERIISLRKRVRQRLKENAEVVGTDEAFFEDEQSTPILDIYNEKAGIFDEGADSDVDLASEAFQIWQAASDQDRKQVERLPNVVYSTKAHVPYPGRPEGALVYVQTGQDNDSLLWVDKEGNVASQSTLAVFRAAACDPGTPALPRTEFHHEIVRSGVTYALKEQSSPGGQLGRPRGARFKTYERLKRYQDSYAGTMWDSPDLARAMEELLRFPLLQTATDTLNRQIKSGISDERLAELVIDLRRDGRFCKVSEEGSPTEPSVVCSLGLRDGSGGK